MLHSLCVNVLRHGFGTFAISAKRTDNICELVFENDLVDDVDTEAIFERPYTKDNSGSGRDTGLGLAIVKKLRESMQGTVFVQKEAHRLAIYIISPFARLFQNDSLYQVETSAGATVMR